MNAWKVIVALAIVLGMGGVAVAGETSPKGDCEHCSDAPKQPGGYEGVPGE